MTAQAILIDNVFDPRAGSRRVPVSVGATLENWVFTQFGHTQEEFARATLVQVNGAYVLFEPDPAHPDALLFDYVVQPGDLVTVTTLPEGIETIVIAIVAVVVAVAVTLLVQEPVNPSQGQEGADPVYTLKGQTNRLRLGEPVEVHYGKTRVWPSYAAPPYNYYENNEQFQLSLFCWGQGDYDFGTNEFFIEDTPAEDFEEVEIEVVPPGGTVTLFPNYVVTSVEVSNIELFGPNEEEYDGWSGPFVVNPAGSEINRVEVDMTCPQGLYQLYEAYRIPRTVEFEVEVRQIDDAGSPVGAWTKVIDETVTRQTNTPQRMTFKAAVTAGRYEARARRTNNRDNATTVVDLLQWEALRGFSGAVSGYGDVTLVALKARATNQLNNNTRSRFNGYSTRKLHTYSSITGWSTTKTATRNPMWALCDVFMATYGGRLTEDYLVMDDIFTLATLYDEREEYFDWTFDQPITVWEAAKAIARVGRAVPLPQGSRVTVVRDEPVSLASAVFTPANIVKESLSCRLRLFEFDPHDSLRIEYTDPVTWKPKQVLCQIPGQPANHPDTLKLIGCTQRDHAYREGMFILAGRYYQREAVTLTTGMEGHVPTYLDLVDLAHPDVDRGVGGMVLAFNTGTRIMTLSQQVDLHPVFTNVIQLRKKDGSANGEPIEVSAVPGEPNKVELAELPPEALVFEDDAAPVLFILGVASVYAFRGKVANLQPQGDNTVELTLVNYDERVYGFDDYPVPADPTVSMPINDDNGAVTNVRITTVPDNPQLVLVSWKPTWSSGYRIERTFDLPVTEASNWEFVAEVPWDATSAEIPAYPAEMVVRVTSKSPRTLRARTGSTGYSTVQLVGVAGSIPAKPVLNATQEAFTGLSAKVAWQPAVGAAGYTVQVFKTGSPTPLRSVDVLTTLEYEYTSAMMAADDATPSRNLDLSVKSYNTAGPSSESSVRQVTNLAPAALTGLTSTLLSGSDYTLSWNAVTGSPTDFLEYRVYASTTPGFTPSASNLVYQGSSTSYVLNCPTTTYWRVAAFDVWSSGHADANFAAQQSVVP